MSIRKVSLQVLACLLISGNVMAESTESEAKGGESALRTVIKKAEAEAIVAALAWLKLLDEEKFAESWDTASNFLKGKVSSDKWQTDITQAVKPYGKIQSRENLGCMLSTRLPGMPEGDYVIMQFESASSSGKKVVETLTMLLENNAWKAAGYYIAPAGLAGLPGMTPSLNKPKRALQEK
jgi:hypothetical protein